MHTVLKPKIMYFGTPVVLISTLNEDGSANLAPMSSAWWLGDSCVLGLGQSGKTAENILRTGECVLNLPSSEMVSVVDKLALTTGKTPVPDFKAKMGYKYIKDKLGLASLTPVNSEMVGPPRVLECPVQLEAKLEKYSQLGESGKFAYAIEVNIIRMHIEENLLSEERRHYVDTDKWRPLIMSFCEFYDLGNNVHPSRLAKVF